MARTDALRAILASLLLVSGACGDLSSDPAGAPIVPALGSAETSAQIQAARDAADGTGLSLPIQGAFVTYVRPLAIGADSAGFAIQSQGAGPALFVSVDPLALSPVPRAGDRVDLTVTAMSTTGSRREATAISGYGLVAEGVSLGTLVQELSPAVDLVSGLQGYESELSSVTGDLRTDFAGASNGFVAAGLNTAAITNDPLLVFRLPTALRDALDLALGCRVSVTAVPLWRSDATVQVTAWAAADLDVVSCPAPRLESAAALSSTLVRVRFDRVLDPASVLADGSQFTFDGGLVATSASASGNVVTVSTTAQGSGALYAMTVAPSVLDLYDSPVDPAFDQATFTGYVAPAWLRLSELNASVTGGADLVELEVITGGTVRDAVLQTGVGTPIVLATLPALEVGAGDLIVVHLSPAAGIVTETAAKDACTDAACLPGAWDVAGGAAGIVDSTRVVAVKAALGVIMDAVPFTDGSTTGGLGSFLTDLQDLQAFGLWLPADCGGELCTLASSPTALEIAVTWSGMGTAATGPSVRRTVAVDGDTGADWAVGTSSFGLANY